MVFSSLYTPHPSLQSFIRYYHMLHVRLDAHTARSALPVKPYPPATEQCLYFYPYDRPHSVKAGHTSPEGATPAIIVGQPLTRMNITINPNYLMLKVSFQPGGLFRLLGVPMHLLTDGHADLEAVTGNAVREIHERLLEADSYPAMIRLVDTFLRQKAAQCRQPELPIDIVARQMLQPTGHHQLDQLADDACLSVRQFERKFRERLGISPKLFLRITRFREAYRLRELNPARSWLNIAYDCQYYDPNHLIKDFQQFAGTSPTQLFDDELAHRAFFAPSALHPPPR